MKHSRDCSFKVMTAADLGIGQNACISSLGKGRSFRSRMLGLGVRPGAYIQIMTANQQGPVIVKIGSQKVMLGCEMLSAIYINGDNK